MSGEQKYFQEALSDFMFDVASGGAIRQMANRGYSVDQIMKSLDFPTPRERVEQTVYRHLLSCGILLEHLPCEETAFKQKRLLLDGTGQPAPASKKTLFSGQRQLTHSAREKLSQQLKEHLQENGEENSYILCPFGEWKKYHKEKLPDLLYPLNDREREYIMGIPFARNVMYHRLSGRMYEIGMKLVLGGVMEGRFYFLKEKLLLRADLQRQE